MGGKLPGIIGKVSVIRFIVLFQLKKLIILGYFQYLTILLMFNLSMILDTISNKCSLSSKDHDLTGTLSVSHLTYDELVNVIGVYIDPGAVNPYACIQSHQKCTALNPVSP